MTDAVDRAIASGIPVPTHANGEGAQDMLVSAVDAAPRAHGEEANRRPVLIHGQFMRGDQADSYRRLHVFPSIFPMQTCHWGDWHRNHAVGPALADGISPTG